MVLLENRLRFALYSGTERPLPDTRRLVSMVSMFELPESSRWAGAYVTPYPSNMLNGRARDRSQAESFMAIPIVLYAHYARSHNLDISKQNSTKVYQNNFNLQVIIKNYKNDRLETFFIFRD
ncbi:hypothetical protein PENCOP_c002G04588 [Penicillium coprophilum]|uniref:Uncharacterized protein n=1 Tax=Penicillium coprophilum TaxID=36646 RepID=A0A1V6V119_9EURO|nr:hypothetical protein PENCOP_c002G04588 [Penicillium coprophilum]